MKFRTKIEVDNNNNTIVLIQIRRLFLWKTMYYSLTNGIDGVSFWPIVFPCFLPYNPDVNELMEKLRTDKELYKKYYIKTLFGYKKL
jgi:hypothetical protein